MASKNGIKKAITEVRTSETVVDIDKGFKTKGLTAALEHPTPLDPTLEWACAGHPDPETFHPTSDEALAAAQALCAGCPTRALCLGLGKARSEWGVWGGVLLEDGKPVERVRKPGRPKRAKAA